MTKNSERHYGYKNHINADAKTKIITKYSVNSAAPHNSTEIENLLDEYDNIAYADSAYRSKKIETYLEDKNCKSHIHLTYNLFRFEQLVRLQKVSMI